jgi:hypothetical protein
MRHDLARIAVKPNCGPYPPEMVDSFAGVGFWYIPNRVGGLSVSIAASLHELGRQRWHLLAGCECSSVDYDDRHTFSLLPEQLIKKG